MFGQLKICGGCQEGLPLEEFAFKDRAAGRLQSRCKPCSRSYAQAHYRDNPKAYVDKAARNNTRYRERNRALVSQSLVGQACCGCGASIDLTHYLGPGEPAQPVHMAVHAACSEQAVLDALGRSVVVCRTCLGHHFEKGIEFWQHLSSRERKRLTTARGPQAPDKSRHKAYRPVDFSVRGD